MKLRAAAADEWSEQLAEDVAGTVAVISAAWTANDAFLSRILPSLLSRVVAVLVADADGDLGLAALPELLGRLEGAGLCPVHRTLVRAPRRGVLTRESPLIVLAGVAGVAVEQVLAGGARGLRSTRWLMSVRRSAGPHGSASPPTRSLGQHNGGIGTANTNLAQALARGGHDVTLLFTGQYRDEHAAVHEHWARRYARDDLRYEVIRELDEAAPQIPHYNARRAYQLLQWLLHNGAEQPFDVVHFPSAKGMATTRFTPSTAVRRSQTLCSWPALIPRPAGAQRRTRSFRARSTLLSTNTSSTARSSLQTCSSARAHTCSTTCENAAGSCRAAACPAVRRRSDGPAAAGRVASAADVGSRRSRVLRQARGTQRHRDLLRRNRSARLEAHCAVSRGATREFVGRPEHIAGVPAVDYVARRSRSWPWTHEVVGELPQTEAMSYLRNHNSSPSCHRPSTTRRTQCRKR